MALLVERNVFRKGRFSFGCDAACGSKCGATILSHEVPEREYFIIPSLAT
jgi:hypothetical protein